MLAEDLRPEEMFKLDDNGLPVTDDERLLVAVFPPMVRLIKDLIRSMGWRKACIIFNRMGYDWGLAQAKWIRSQYDFDSAEEWLKSGSVLRRCSGLAIEEIEEITYNDAGKIVSFSGTWQDTYEVLVARAEPGYAPEPVCRILAGVASGFASAVLGEEILVRETACQASGYGFCKFEGRPVEAWGVDLIEVKQYFAVTNLEEELSLTYEMIQKAREEMVRQNDEINRLKKQTRLPETEDGIVFRSDSIAKALYLAEKVAPTNSTVLIQGESGTGKELIARYIHRHSGRKDKSFLAINCAALPPNLLESELFGHVKGAFTGADSNKVGLFVEAGEGTIFLDEVGEMPLELQAKLLRVLQEKEVRPVGGLKNQPIAARIVAATNRDMREMVMEGKYREDLYYRLAVFPLPVTPLRDRKQDILPLARYFLAQLNRDHKGFSPEAVRCLTTYHWPGNVRELENWIEYASVLSGDERIEVEHLPQYSLGCQPDLLTGLAGDYPTQSELERRYIQQVLEHTDGNKAEAARILGLSISTLWRRLKQFDTGQADETHH